MTSVKKHWGLGFGVVNADDHARPGDNLEDLHITDQDVPGWTAIAEVKGYTRGAATSALTQLMRFSMRYVERTGKAPDAQWYIANQFRNQDPSTRQRILHGKDEDVRVFAAGNGLVIDTVVLFRILEELHAGKITAAQARTHLRTSTGILDIPATRK